MSPTLNFIKLTREYGVEPRYYLRAFLYFLKYLVADVFMRVERFFFGKKINSWVHDDPVFIIGYYRSGTTHLQELLLQDRRWGYLTFFQCLVPHGASLLGRPFFFLFDSILKLIRFRHPAHQIPLRLHMPGEEDVCMVSMGCENAANWGQVFPKHFKKFFSKYVFFEGDDADKNRLAFKKFLKQFVKEVAFLSKKKRVLLKSPPQTARVEVINELYPNAKFIFIHRDPYRTFKSNQVLWDSFLGQQLQKQESQEVNENILWSYDKCMNAFESARGIIGEDRLAEVRFDDLMSNPLATVEQVYQKLNMGSLESFKVQLQDYIQLNHGKNVKKHTTSKSEENFVKTELATWYDRYSY